MTPLFHALRPAHAAKNLLVFIPIVAAHRLADPSALGRTALAALAFCLVAASVYLVNDLADAAADRLHPVKRHRPAASGQVGFNHSTALAAALALLGMACAVCVSVFLAVLLAVYFAVAHAYNTRLKRMAPLDIFCLTFFYLARLAAGHIAAGVKLSPWLSIFCLFLFLSLAICKRHAELQLCASATNGRGYVTEDAESLRMLGNCCSLAAVIVLALYTQGSDVRSLYSHPDLLLLLCPMALYWVFRLWFRVGRGHLPDDPFTAIITDGQTYILALTGALTLYLAT